MKHLGIQYTVESGDKPRLKDFVWIGFIRMSYIRQTAPSQIWLRTSTPGICKVKRRAPDRIIIGLVRL
jgi:hypothetical protein